jgi:tetratricopeptide (TPR) repeat protein
MIRSAYAIRNWSWLDPWEWALSLVLLVNPILCQAQLPGKPCDAQQIFKTTDGLIKLKHYQEAEAALDPLQRCHHLSPLERFNLGWLYGRAHDFRTALNVFQSVPSGVPDLVTHDNAIALSQFELRDYRGTVETLKNLQAQNGLDERSANLLGVSYCKLGLYQDAYRILKEELQKNPSDLDAYLNLVTLFADTGAFVNAVDIARQAVLVFPQNSELLVVRGAVNTQLGKLEAAHADFASAANLSPKAAEPRFLLALSDYKQGNFTLAITELRSATRSGIVDSDLHYLIAECMLRLVPLKSDDAITELTRAIEINPRSVSARALRGRLLLEEGQAAKAVADLEAAHQIDPGSHSAGYNLARAYSAIGRKKEAKELFAQLAKDFHQDLEDQRNTELFDTLAQQKLRQVLAGDAPPQ